MTVLTALAMLVSAPVFAQGQVEAAAAATRGQIIDLAGSWANRLHEDWIERAPGPHIGDYSGLPINDEARAYADLYQVSMQNMPERQCILYTSQYIVMGPQNLRIEPDVDPISGAIVALHMTGTVDRAPHTVWMDGRAHPSKNAPHTPGGFSTGVWQGQRSDRLENSPETAANSPAGTISCLTGLPSKVSDSAQTLGLRQS